MGAAYGNGKFLIAGASILEADLLQGFLVEPTFRADRFEFSLLGQVGQTYELQAIDSLNQSNWHALGAITNNHVLTHFIDNSPLPAHLFFRAASREK